MYIKSLWEFNRQIQKHLMEGADRNEWSRVPTHDLNFIHHTSTGKFYEELVLLVLSGGQRCHSVFCSCDGCMRLNKTVLSLANTIPFRQYDIIQLVMSSMWKTSLSVLSSNTFCLLWKLHEPRASLPSDPFWKITSLMVKTQLTWLMCSSLPIVGGFYTAMNALKPQVTSTTVTASN